MATKAKIGVLGASGYTGGELVRLLLRHPRAEIVLLTAERSAGKAMRDVFPQFSPYELPKLVAIEGLDWAAADLDVAFCALPHATTQKVLDDADGAVAADQGDRPVGRFPPADTAAYAKWYGHEHHAPDAAEGSGLRADRNPPARDQAGPARRQSRLLHVLRRAAAHSADQGQGDRTRARSSSTPSPA